MKIEFNDLKERDAFHAILEMAAYGPRVMAEPTRHPSDVFGPLELRESCRNMHDRVQAHEDARAMDDPDSQGNHDGAAFQTLVNDRTLSIKEEHLKRMGSFLRVFATVIRLTDKDPHSQKRVTSAYAEREDGSLIWQGFMTVGMVYRENKERPWAGEWSGHS